MFDEYDIPDTVVCPMCEDEQLAEAVLLGTLGNLNHYRCRCCGWDWQEQAA